MLYIRSKWETQPHLLLSYDVCKREMVRALDGKAKLVLDANRRSRVAAMQGMSFTHRMCQHVNEETLPQQRRSYDEHWREPPIALGQTRECAKPQWHLSLFS